MKRRILAIVLVLMLAVSLLPVSAAADDYAYVSVNGVAITELDKAIPCGSGTAKLRYDNYTGGFELNLVNATIDKFENVLSQDGVSYYAGIVFQGNVPLEICSNGKVKINAPSHNASKYYEGVLADGNVTFSESGPYNTSSLTVSGVDCGIDGANGYVRLANTTVNINSSDAGILCDRFENRGSYLTINCTGSVGIAADTALSTRGIVINLTPDVKKGYYDCYGLVAEDYILQSGGTEAVNRFNINYDGSGYKGADPITVCGVEASTIGFGDYTDNTNIEVNMNVSCTKNIYVAGVSAGTCQASGLKCNLKLKGQHGDAVGVITEELALPARLNCTVSGATADDIALMAGSIKSGFGFDYFYVGTDCTTSEVGAMLIENGVPESLFAKYKVFEPKYGGIGSLTEDGKNAIAVDADENPSNILVIRNKDYPFTDIEGNSLAPYKDATVWAYENGITAGTDPITFSPNMTCTREQIVTFLWRAMGCPEPTIKENPFTDVASTGLGAPFYKAILWAYENGITMGTDATHFSPKLVCTRSQVVTFLWRAVGCPEPESTENVFKDVKDDSFYFKPVLWAVEKGITNGTDAPGSSYVSGKKTFSPDAVCTRCQIVTFIYRDKDEIIKTDERPSAVSAVIKADAEAADRRHTLRYFMRGVNYYYLCPVNLEVTFSDGSKQMYTLELDCAKELTPDNAAEVVTVRDGKVYVLIKDKLHAERTGFYGNLVVFDPLNMKMEHLLYADRAWLSEDGTRLNGYYEYNGHSSETYEPKDFVVYYYVSYDFESGVFAPFSCRDYEAYVTDEGIYYCSAKYDHDEGQSYWTGIYRDFDKLEETVLFKVPYTSNRGSMCATDETGFTLTYTFDTVTTVLHYDFNGNEILPE